MKMVKSLLLGSAAGVVAIAGAQAADLPVKAKPVQYVKICSLYGAGFYYIPGTDTCLKIGGFVRAEYNINTASGSYVQYNAVNFDSRATNDTHMRTRGGISADARTQTAYGTLRAYVNIAPTVTDIAPGTGTAIWHNRAFIQFAGFTAGLAASFFDFDPISSYSNQTNRLGSSVGGTGIPLFAYTAQLGNGFSATIAAESPAHRRTAIFSTTGTGYGGWQWPDVVGNVRVDQAWGSAQVMGAIHQVRPGYYTASATSGGPGQDVGYALGAGLRLNLPMLGKGDFLITQFTYAEGAIGYVGAGLATYNIQNGTGNPSDPVTVAYGPVFDAAYGPPGSGLNLTKGWSVTAGFQHNWNAQWRTSVYGAYGALNYTNPASAYILWSGTPGALGGAVAPTALTTGTADWSLYQVGSRTMWTPVPNLQLSVEVMYNHVNTAYDSSPGYEDKGWVSGIFRVQRNFYP